MTSIDYTELSKQVRDALRKTFTGLLASNPDQAFYAFAIWTDDSLQFLSAAANTEEALASTVKHYRREVDPVYDTKSTYNGMRWSHGDWGFFPIDDGEEYFSDINAVLQSNFSADENVFEAQMEPLWQALLDGFLQLEHEGFFGAGDVRSKITLLLVGDLDEDVVDQWVAALNPPDVAERYFNWDYDAPDTEVGG